MEFKFIKRSIMCVYDSQVDLSIRILHECLFGKWVRWRKNVEDGSGTVERFVMEER